MSDPVTPNEVPEVGTSPKTAPAVPEGGVVRRQAIEALARLLFELEEREALHRPSRRMDPR